MVDRAFAAAVGVGLVTLAVFAPAIRNAPVPLDAAATLGSGAAPLAANVALHALNATLVTLVLTRATGTLVASVFAASLFALHPLRVESVAWLGPDRALAGMAAALVGLLAYEAWARRGGWGRYAAAVAAYALAVAATPLTTPLPFLLLLLDAWPLARLDVAAPERDPRLWSRLIEKLPFAVVVAAMLAFTASVPALSKATLGMQVADAFANVVRSVWVTVLPLGLTPLRPAASPPWWSPGAVLAVVATTAAVLASRRRVPFVAIGWLWFLVALLPVLAATPADRFTYLPSVGFALAVAAGLATLDRRRGLAGATALVVLAACIATTARQITYWHDEESVLRRVLATTADNVTAERRLGTLLAARGAWEEATRHTEEAARLRPDDPEARNDLGVVRLHAGHADAAADLFAAAAAARPDFAAARLNLVRAELQRGRVDAALALAETILADAPDDPAAHAMLGRALRQRGRLDEARVHFERALALGAPPADVLGGLAQTLAEAGDVDGATARYRELLALVPDDGAAHDRLGTLAARRGDLATAEAEYRAALRLRPDFAEAQLHLGTVLAAGGDALHALRAFDAAHVLAPRLPSLEYNRALALEVLGEPGEAVRALRAELVVQPSWPPALLRLAALLAARGAAQRAEAAQLADRAAESLGADDPDVQAVRDLLQVGAHSPESDSP